MFAFVYPYQLNPDASLPSQSRPVFMANALGDELDHSLIISMGKNRFDNLNDKSINSLYLEMINRPFLVQRLIERNYDIWKDYRDLRKLKERGVRLGLFYRDAYWVNNLSDVGVHKWLRSPLGHLYRRDWIFIKEIFDVIYLPSLQLASILGEKNINIYKELPPGCVYEGTNGVVHRKKRARLVNTIFRLIYVGAIIPPLYDISPALKLFGNRKGVEITLLVRSDQLNILHRYYRIEHYNNVRVISGVHGEALADYYRKSDAALLLYEAHRYRDAAAPYKAFEALGYGLPLLVNSSTAIADIVDRNSLGVILPKETESIGTYEILDIRDKIESVRNKVKEYALNNTWTHRAQTVISDLS